MVVAAASAIDAVPRLIAAYRNGIGVRRTLSPRNRTLAVTSRTLDWPP
jgi:hypothetical protein